MSEKEGVSSSIVVVDDYLIKPANTWCFCGGSLDYGSFPLSHSPTRWPPSSPPSASPDGIQPPEGPEVSSGAFWARCNKKNDGVVVNNFKDHKKIREGLLSSWIWKKKKRITSEYTMWWRSSKLLNIISKFWSERNSQTQVLYMTHVFWTNDFHVNIDVKCSFVFFKDTFSVLVVLLLVRSRCFSIPERHSTVL